MIHYPSATPEGGPTGRGGYMISYYLGSFTLLLALLIVEQSMWDANESSQTAIDTVIALLWLVLGVPYILRSRRVKNTFVKRAVPPAPNPAG